MCELGCWYIIFLDQCEYTIAVARSDGKIETFAVQSVHTCDSTGITHQISSLGWFIKTHLKLSSAIKCLKFCLTIGF